jgi:Na+/H+-dicarboxylate symporter
LLTVAGALLYVVVRTAGAVPLRRFARAVLPAQVIAVSTRSSVAALPAMLESAERVLHLPPSVTGFVLPFGVAVFRINQGITWVVSALFIGKLYGVHLAWSQLALFAATSVAMSFSVPGIPSAALFMIAPFFPMVGLPVEGVGILIGLDVIPDLFKTSLNVTGHMAATVLLAREQETPGVAAPALPVEARLPAYR